MIFEVECDTTKRNELTDRTHTRIVSFIVLDILQFFDSEPEQFVLMSSPDVTWTEKKI